MDATPSPPGLHPHLEMLRFVSAAGRDDGLFELGLSQGMHRVRDALGYAAVDVAINKDELEALSRLLASGASFGEPTPGILSPLASACALGRTEAARALICAGHPVDYGGFPAGPAPMETPLMRASASGHADCAELLLALGADPGIANSDGVVARSFGRHHPDVVAAFDRDVARREALDIGSASRSAPAKPGGRL